MNLRVKFRESFRPFAPAVLAEHAADVFELEGESPYMLLVAPVREALRRPDDEGHAPGAVGGEDLLERVRQVRSTLPAITHVDGSGRLQTVYRETNPAYHGLIERFGELTGVPVIMNTSFNLKGEPIVESPAHAFNTFSLSGMDLLFLNNFVIRADAKKKIAETAFHLRHEGDSVTAMVS